MAAPVASPAPAAAAAAKSDDVAAVYEAFAKLADAKDPSTEKKAFESLIDAVKGGSKVKQLAAQYIPRFLKHFADLSERALNAQLDLCEDEELAVRVHAIRSLADLCKGSPVHTQRIADVLSQLLVAEDHTELATVKRTFGTLFEIDSRAAFAALLTQIKDGDEPLRAKGIEFFKAQLATAKAAIDKNPEMQKDMAANIKKILVHPDGVTAEEFKYFLSVLQSMKTVRDDPNLPSEIAAIVIKQANLDSKFDPANEEYVAQFISCLQTAQPLFQKKKGSESAADNAPFLNYFFGKMLPVLETIPEKSRLNVLRAITDTSRFITAEEGGKVIEPLLEAIKKHVPKAAAAGADASKINYFAVECLLFMLQTIAAKSPALMRTACGVFVPSGQPTDILSADIKEKRDDLTARFTFLSTSAKSYAEQCKTAATNISKTVKQEKDENEKKTLLEKRVAVQMAMRSAANSITLVTNFLNKIPQFGTADVYLSWKAERKRQNQAKAAAGSAAAAGGNAGKASGDSKGTKRTRSEAKGKGKAEQKDQKQQQPKKAGGRPAKRQKQGAENYVAPKRDQTPEPKRQGGGGGRGSRGRGGKRGGGGAQQAPRQQQQQQQQQSGRGRSNSRGRGGKRGGRGRGK